MQTWLTYSPQDFLPFSDRVYWRLFELNNAALWPAQIPAVLAGIAVVGLLIARPLWAGRAIAAVLALAWMTTALTFLPRYGVINWAAGNLVPVFLAQALLLAALGCLRDGLRPDAEGVGRWSAIALVLYGLAVYPAAALVTGRSVSGLDVFALTPDSTAIATLGAVLACGRRWPGVVLMAVPLFWCLVSWATLATLGAPEAWALGLAGMVFLASSVKSFRR